MRFFLSAALVGTITSPAIAFDIQTMTFEGVSNLAPVDSYYSGSGPANVNLGVTFTGGVGLIQAIEFGGPSVIDGGGNLAGGFGSFMHQPPGFTILTFAPRGVDSTGMQIGGQSEITMRQSTGSAGFNSFSMNYAATNGVWVIPLDANGADLFANGRLGVGVLHLEDQNLTCQSEFLPGNSSLFCGVPQNPPTGGTRTWASDGITFAAGVLAYGLRFETDVFNNGGFDNLTLGSETPGQIQTLSVPEPSTWALMVLGMLGIGFAARRRMT